MAFCLSAIVVFMEQERRKAAEKGEVWYFTGKPCSRGHLSRRQVSNGGCDECMHPGRKDNPNYGRNQEVRHKAVVEGKLRYFTGLPCKHGHVAERWVSTGGCVECVSPKLGAAHRRLQMRQEMKNARFNIPNKSRDFFEQILFGLVQSKYSDFLKGDIVMRRKVEMVSLDRTLREYRIFPEHEEFLRELEKTLS